MNQTASVVVVEDEKFVLMGLRSYLSSYPDEFEVIGAFRNGTDALAFCLASPPDILLTDIKMPQMDGLELISQLRRSRVPTKAIVLSCHDELDLVRKAFREGARTYILKDEIEEEELVRILREVMTEVGPIANLGSKKPTPSTPLYLIDLLQDPGALNDSLPARVQHAGLASIGVVGFKAEYNHRQEPLSGVMDERALLQTARDALRNETNAIVVHGRHNNVSLAVYEELESTLRGEQKRIGALLLDALAPVFNRTAFVAFSTIGPRTELSLESYEEARQSLEYMFFFADPRVLQAEALRQDEESVQLDSTGGLDLALSDTFENWAHVIHRYFNPLRDSALRSPAAVKNEVDGLLQRLEWQLRSVSGASLAHFLELAEPIGYQRIEQFDDVRALEQWLLSLLRMLRDSMQRTQERDALVSNVITFLQEHFTAAISLTELAERFNVHPNYLSSHFKQLHGLGIVEYVNSLRIERAKTLLQVSNLTLKEISYQVGFDSPNYFSRIFKRVTGQTATEFRDRSAASSAPGEHRG